MYASGSNNINLIQESMIESGIVKNKNQIDVPDLLLSYTYFLKNDHSSHLTIGYSTEDFNCKILLFKNGKICLLDIMDWKNLFDNLEIIESFFCNINDLKFIELPHCGGNIIFKLSIRNDKKCIISSYNNRKVALHKEEFLKLQSLSPYLNSIVSWYSNMSVEIRNYYMAYLQICIDNNVLKLSPNQFFIIEEQTRNFYNNSRLFNELPILCKKKLRDDLSKYYNSRVQY